MELRSYQQKAVDDLRRSFQLGRKRVILQMPTGSGKTVVACEIIRRTLDRGGKVIFLVNRRELAFQASQKLDEYGIDYPRMQAIIMGNLEYYPAAPVQICSVQTLYSRREQIGQLHPSLIIYDECHDSVAPSRRAVLGHPQFEAAHWIGLSATPTRNRSRGSLGLLWEEIVAGPTYAELIQHGHLVRTRVYCPSIPDLSGISASNGEFIQNSDLRKRMESEAIYGDVFREFERYGSDRSTIVFCVNRAHARGVCDRFIERGYTAAYVDGTTDKKIRDETIKDFKAGDIQIIVNCKVFGEGLDVPIASCVINLKPTKSLCWFRQSMNRIQRPHPSKKDAIVLDHTGSTLRFGYPDSDEVEWNLDEATSMESLVNTASTKEKVQSICKMCGAYLEPSQGSGKCPGCGHVFKKPARLPYAFKGSLRELAKKKIKKESSTLDYQKEWMKCLAVAAYRRGTVQSARGHFRNVTGTFPEREKVSPLPERSQYEISVRVLYPGFIRKKRV